MTAKDTGVTPEEFMKSPIWMTHDLRTKGAWAGNRLDEKRISTMVKEALAHAEKVATPAALMWWGAIPSAGGHVVVRKAAGRPVVSFDINDSRQVVRVVASVTPGIISSANFFGNDMPDGGVSWGKDYVKMINMGEGVISETRPWDQEQADRLVRAFSSIASKSPALQQTLVDSIKRARMQEYISAMRHNVERADLEGASLLSVEEFQPLADLVSGVETAKQALSLMANALSANNVVNRASWDGSRCLRDARLVIITFPNEKLLTSWASLVLEQRTMLVPQVEYVSSISPWLMAPCNGHGSNKCSHSRPERYEQYQTNLLSAICSLTALSNYDMTHLGCWATYVGDEAGQAYADRVTEEVALLRENFSEKISSATEAPVMQGHDPAAAILWISDNARRLIGDVSTLGALPIMGLRQAGRSWKLEVIK